MMARNWLFQSGASVTTTAPDVASVRSPALVVTFRPSSLATRPVTPRARSTWRVAAAHLCEPANVGRRVVNLFPRQRVLGAVRLLAGLRFIFILLLVRRRRLLRGGRRGRWHSDLNGRRGAEIRAWRHCR